MGVIEETKELLSDNRYRIKLHDLVATQVREVLSLTAEDQFPVQGNWPGVGTHRQIRLEV